MPAEWRPTYDNYIIHAIYRDPLDAKVDLLPLFDQEWAWRDSQPHTIHLLLDVSQIRRVPNNWLALRSGPGFKHPRAGEIILIGLAPGFRVLLDTLLRITHFNRLHAFTTFQEAEPYITALVERTKAINAQPHA